MYFQTTLARIVAQKCKESHNTRFTKLSATTSGVADVKEAVKVAKTEWSMFKRTTVLFIDEVHRFNKLQQVGSGHVTYRVHLKAKFVSVCLLLLAFDKVHRITLSCSCPSAQIYFTTFLAFTGLVSPTR